MNYHQVIMKENLTIPKEILNTIKTLKNKGFLAYCVGGCVRDLLNQKKPKDWDITTDATPEEIISLFPKTFYENKFGTVTIVLEETPDETLKNIEVTPFRTEGSYSDSRRPDTVSFAKNIDEDLLRRDFTINAIAYDPVSGETIDPYTGQEDIKNKNIKAVGDPKERFEEDPLRIMRAIRFYSELGFTIEAETLNAIENVAPELKKISWERIRDEFTKIIDSEKPMEGLILLQKTGILTIIAPEIEEGLHVEQGGEHKYDVWAHSLRTVQHAADKKYSFHVKLAALFHDIGKPKTRRTGGKNKKYTFFGHEVVGARMAKKIMVRMKYPKKVTETVEKLVRNHMFFSDTEQITLSAVRRIIAKVGEEDIWELMRLRICDRIGMGRPKEEPYRLRKYESMIEEALRAPTSVGMLKIDGQKIIDKFHVKPSPKIGFILHALLEEVLTDPARNTEEYLNKKTKELLDLPENELKKLGESGRDKKEKTEEEELKEIRGKYGVK